MIIHPLYEGSFSVDISKKFIPFDPLIHRASDRPASLFVHVSPFLIETQKGLILIDTGLGQSNANAELQIIQNIRNLGFEPTDVKYVLMSHLHFDHAAGMMQQINGTWHLNFPNAQYFLQKTEIEYALARPGKSYDIPQIEALLATPNVVILHEADGAIDDFISYQITGGHCPEHQVFWLKENNDIIFYGGDVLPEPEQLIRNFVAKYDTDGVLAKELRQSFGISAVANNWQCLFYHAKKNAVGFVREKEGAFVVV